jgi:hypothetical protein
MKARTASAIAALPLMLAACGSAKHDASAPAVSAPAAASSSPAAAPPVLSASQENFVTGVQAKYDTSESPGTLAKMGATICSMRADGAAASTISAAVGGNGHHATARVITRLAERDLCRQYLPKKPRVLIRFSGSGILNSAPFRVTSSTVTVHYTYDCASFGTSGNFIADMETGNQASLGSDDQSIANALGSGGSQVTTLYPRNVGSIYHIAVNSDAPGRW